MYDDLVEDEDMFFKLPNVNEMFCDTLYCFDLMSINCVGNSVKRIHKLFIITKLLNTHLY